MTPEENRAQGLQLLQSLLDYQFMDIELLNAALTHKSFALEQQEDIEHCERLEFLGDATVNLIVSRYLLDRFPGNGAGALTKLRAAIVNNISLARMAREMHLGDSIRLGKGERQSGGQHKPSILAGCLEALIGSIYLETDMEKASDIFLRRFGNIVEKIISDDGTRDPKSDLQEFTQRELDCMPVYRIVSENGPEHQKIFEAELSINGHTWSRGAGRSKKEAEQEAAMRALKKLQKEEL